MEMRVNRRKLLSGAVAGVGTYALMGGPAVLTARGAIARDGRFRQGVASGMPAKDSITLWTRVEDFSGANRVRLEVARDSDFKKLVYDDSQDIDRDSDDNVKKRVRNLDPGEEYFYRFYTRGGESSVGRFRTLRPQDSNEPVRLGFFSCQEYVSGYYHAHDDMAKQDLDIIVCLGDYVYEKRFDDNPVPGREDDTGRDGDVQTLDEYREKYNLYNSDPDLRRMRESAALVTIWDDHEVEDNYAGERPGGQTPDRRVPFEKRQRNGYRAHFEHLPNMPFRNSALIYGSLALGNADLFLIDTRQYRDNQPCDADDTFPSDPCPSTEYNERGRKLLGGRQKDWLKSGLERSDARWKIVANQMMIMSLDTQKGTSAENFPLNTDQWDGYGDERRELIDHIRDEDIENVTFITGDIHTFFAGVVYRSGRDNQNPTDEDAGPVFGDGPRPAATEFVGGGITSKGIVDRATTEECGRIAGSRAGDVEAREANNHFRFTNQAYKGYAFLEAGDDLKVTYRGVREPRRSREERRDDEVFELARFTVANGVSEVNMDEDNSEMFAPECPSGSNALPPNLINPR